LLATNPSLSEEAVMVMDALRGYVQLANGLTEVTRQRAQQAAKALLQQTGAESLTSGLSSKVSDLADEIVATSKSNRQLLQAIVANEVEGAVARLGFVRAEEVAALARRIEALEKAAAAAGPAPTAAKKAPAATRAPATTKARAATRAPATRKAPAAKKASAATKATAAKKAPSVKTATANKAAKQPAAKKA